MRRQTMAKYLTLITLVVGLSCWSAFQSRADNPPKAGDLDPSFCGSGQCLSNNFGVTQPTILDIIQQYFDDGQEYIVTFGRQNYSNKAEGSFLTKHTMNGALDPTFGKNGVLLLKDLAIPDGLSRLLVPAHTGRIFGLYGLPVEAITSWSLHPIVLVGSTEKNEKVNDTNITRSVAVLRFVSQSGYLPAPGVEGWIEIGFTPADIDDISPTSPFAAENGGYVSAQGQTLFVQPDRKIVAAVELTAKGTNGGTQLNRLAVIRTSPTVLTNPKNPLDGSFGKGGKVILPGMYIWDSMLQPDGKILLATDNNAAGISVVRLDSAGQLDPNFGTNGTVALNGVFGGGTLVLQPDGKVLFGGKGSQPGANGKPVDGFAMCRLNVDGVIDPNFGTAGCMQVPMSAYQKISVGEIAMQENGKIVMAGTGGTAENNDIITLRLNSYGTLDSSFGDAGIKVTSFDAAGKSNYEGANALLIQKDGKILVGGYVDNYAVSPTASGILQRMNGDATGSGSDGQSLPSVDISQSGPPPNQEAPADLKVTSQSYQNSVKVGNVFLYVVRVENLGPAKASAIQIADMWVGPAEVYKVINSKDVTCVAPTKNGAKLVSCSIASLPVGGKTTIQVELKGTAPGKVHNVAKTTGNGKDPTPDNNTAKSDFTVTAK